MSVVWTALKQYAVISDLKKLSDSFHFLFPVLKKVRGYVFKYWLHFIAEVILLRLLKYVLSI
jgi:membrane protein insertase Oxa1/YidC/SpoIIIJ